MRLVEHFNRFLEEEVNLNKDRIKTLTERVEAIVNFVGGSDWQASVIRFSPQGSWAHKTIIKPPGSAGFDADLLAFVTAVQGWSAKDYVLDLRRVFSESKTYKDKTSLGNRCATIEYSGDFSLDLVPCVVGRRSASARFEVCNRNDDEFEPTDSEAFTAWLEERNGWVGNDNLRKVLRLLKYLRNVKTTFSCKSVLLTTLVASNVSVLDALYRTTYHPDLPTSLKTLMGRLDDYLQARPKYHIVQNPVLPVEHFVRHWDEDKYANFREVIHLYRGWIDEAYDAPELKDSIVNWRRVFDTEFARGAEVEKAFAADVPLPVVYGHGRFRDAVEAVKTVGYSLLARVPLNLPWVVPAPRVLNNLAVAVRATEHASRGGPTLREIAPGALVGKRSWIQFHAVAQNGNLIAGKDFIVKWQVVNTDRDALTARALRGGFYPSDKPGQRWESTLYRGIHWVEAFVIRKRDGGWIGRSGPFFVVIE